MPADVERMMYVGQVPWHGIGTALPTEVNSEVAIRVAGLDWEVEKAPIVTNDQKRTGIDDYRVTRRVSDSAILGVVRKTFHPIQNRDAFRFFDNVVGAGKAVYHTAGSLQGGSKIFMLAKLPGVMEIGKGIGSVDEIERYLLLSNAHDGTRPLQMLFTPVRVVCSNTLSLALRKSSADEETRIAPRVNIRHTVNAKKYLKESERIMAAAVKYYEQFGTFCNFLYSKQLRTAQVSNIVGLAFPPNKRKEVTPKIAEHRNNVTRLFTEGKGHEYIAGSAWALMNAFAEYADHDWAGRGKGDATDRAYSVWMGGAKGLKQRATKLITEAVAA